MSGGCEDHRIKPKWTEKNSIYTKESTEKSQISHLIRKTKIQTQIWRRSCGWRIKIIEEISKNSLKKSNGQDKNQPPNLHPRKKRSAEEYTTQYQSRTLNTFNTDPTPILETYSNFKNNKNQKWTSSKSVSQRKKKPNTCALI